MAPTAPPPPGSAVVHVDDKFLDVYLFNLFKNIPFKRMELEPSLRILVLACQTVSKF
jgi:hypothetical protein